MQASTSMALYKFHQSCMSFLILKIYFHCIKDYTKVFDPFEEFGTFEVFSNIKAVVCEQYVCAHGTPRSTTPF